MLQRKAVVRTPIVRHLASLMVITGELVEEILRIKLTNNTLLVDLLNIQRASRTVRVPDLEIDGVYCAFPRENG